MSQVVEATKSGAALGVVVVPVVVKSGDYAVAFDEIDRARVQALFVAASTYFAHDRQQIIGLAAQHRLPAIYEWREDVQQGGLMTYATSLPERVLRVAGHVARIFKGALPADMPIDNAIGIWLSYRENQAYPVALQIEEATNAATRIEQ